MSAINYYLYAKLCWNRSMSHIAIPLAILEKVLLIGVFLKVFKLDNYVIIGVLGVVGIMSMFVLGHFDLKMGVADKENSLNNKYNPEMRKLVRRKR
jgi:hypothetical protein